MMSLPLPVRLAAGLVATAVEQVRELPRLVVEFPVTAVSQALQVSMRMQQRVTELAIKGDRVLGSLRPVEEAPAWATFDEDLPRNGSTVTELRPQTPRTVRAIPVQRDSGMRTEPELVETAVDIETADIETAGDIETADIETAGDIETAVDVASEPAVVSGPTALPGYDELSIPQLRAKLRTLTVADLRALLAWEQAHEDRPPYVTMLTNRISTVTAQ